MKLVIRYHSQLIFRRRYKAKRVIRIKPAAKFNFVFRPVRFGLKPKLTTLEQNVVEA